MPHGLPFGASFSMWILLLLETLCLAWWLWQWHAAIRDDDPQLPNHYAGQVKEAALTRLRGS
jgi:hypothetical protein